MLFSPTPATAAVLPVLEQKMVWTVAAARKQTGLLNGSGSTVAMRFLSWFGSKFQNGSCDGGIVSYTVQPFSGFTGVFAQSPYMQRRNTVKLSVS